MLVTFEEAGAVRYSISGSGAMPIWAASFAGFSVSQALQQRQEEVPVLEAAAHRLVVAAAALPRDTANHARGRAAIMRHERGGIATSRLDH